MSITLTDGETLRVMRIRKNLTQSDVANMFDVSQTRVSRWESDQVEVPSIVKRRFKNVRELSDQETAMIIRRRNHISVAEMAQRFGVSRYQLIKIESGRARVTEYLSFVRSQC